MMCLNLENIVDTYLFVKNNKVNIESLQFLTTSMSYFNFFNLPSEYNQICATFVDYDQMIFYNVYFIMKNVKIYKLKTLQPNFMFALQINIYNIDEFLKYLFLDTNKLYDLFKKVNIKTINKKLEEINITYTNENDIFEKLLNRREIGYLDLTYLITVFDTKDKIFNNLKNISLETKHKDMINKMNNLLVHILNAEIVNITLSNNTGKTMVYYTLLLNKLKQYKYFPSVLLTSILCNTVGEEKKQEYILLVTELSYLLQTVIENIENYILSITKKVKDVEVVE